MNSRISSFADGQLVDAAQPVGARVQRVVELREQPVDRRSPQLVLRAEVVVEQRLGDAGPRGDLPRRRPIEGELGEQVERGGKDPLPSRIRRGSGCARRFVVCTMPAS